MQKRRDFHFPDLIALLAKSAAGPPTDSSFHSVDRVNVLSRRFVPTARNYPVVLWILFKNW